MKKIFSSIKKISLAQILPAVFAIPVGIIVGIIDAVFGMGLLKITAFRQTYPQYLIPFLPAAGILIAFIYMRYGGKSSKGMNLIFETAHGSEDSIPLRLIPLVIAGTWLTHLFGGSAGREGVAVQIGAAFSHRASNLLPVKNASRILLVAGMAAGFAGLFRTPIAAVFFALEVLAAGELRYDALFPSLTASFAASTTSGILGLEKFSFDLSDHIALNGTSFLKLIIIGILFGLTGGLFAWFLKSCKNFFAVKFPHPVLRIGLIGLVLCIVFLLLYKGRYSGLGTNLIESCFYGSTVYKWDWILKFFLTVFTLAAGFQGGEVTPLFSIGAALGTAVSGLLGFPPEFTAAMGYTAVFGGATNTLLAPILIGGEVFGFEYIPYFFIVCTVSYVFNMNRSIYGLQKNCR